jgi:hypothetical protein
MVRRFSVRYLVLAGGSNFSPLPFLQSRLLSDADVRHRVEQSKYVAEPPQNADNNDRIQDRLDGIRHGDELVDHPQDHSNDDQSEQYLS